MLDESIIAQLKAEVAEARKYVEHPDKRAWIFDSSVGHDELIQLQFEEARREVRFAVAKRRLEIAQVGGTIDTPDPFLLEVLTAAQAMSLYLDRKRLSRAPYEGSEVPELRDLYRAAWDMIFGPADESVRRQRDALDWVLAGASYAG